MLQKAWRHTVFAYIAGILRNKNQTPLIVNGVEDHVHILFALRPSTAIADIVRDVKSNSSAFINEQQWLRGKFNWQEGYGVFSYSRSQLNDIYQYIEQQEEHHKRTSFREEYLELLQKFEIEYQEKYLFDWVGGTT